MGKKRKDGSYKKKRNVTLRAVLSDFLPDSRTNCMLETEHCRRLCILLLCYFVFVYYPSVYSVFVIFFFNIFTPRHGSL